jgi:hypothetical protein
MFSITSENFSRGSWFFTCGKMEDVFPCLDKGNLHGNRVETERFLHGVVVLVVVDDRIVGLFGLEGAGLLGMADYIVLSDSHFNSENSIVL